MSVDFPQRSAVTILEYLSDIIRRTPLVMLAHGTEQENSCLNQEHQDIVSAIEAGNAKRAKN